MSNQSFVTILDFGSNTIKCLHLSLFQGCHLLAYNEIPSRGIIGGNITDMNGLSSTIKILIKKTEKKQNISISNVYAVVSADYFSIYSKSVNVKIDGKIINKDLMSRIASYASKKQIIKHSSISSYSIDNNNQIENPIGMVGQDFNLKINTIFA